MAQNTMQYKLGKHKFELTVGDDAFQPQTVTQKLADEVEITPGCDVLDLGCGTGPLSLYAALEGAGHVWAIDIMPSAIEYCKENVARAGLEDKITVLCGDLFEPVGNRKFDVIINDVSGIAEVAARLSPWYPDVIPTGGEDGTEVVNRMMEQSVNHLKPGGTLYFATSSLSADHKIVAKAKNVFSGKVEQLADYHIPFCKELMESVDRLKPLAEQGKISFEERRSRYLWILKIFKVDTNVG